MAEAVVNGEVQPKQTKAMDMRFHWLHDQECQEQFWIYWRPGKLNYAGYWTKHHAAAHHRHIRKEYLTPHIVSEMLRMEQSRVAAARTQITSVNQKFPPETYFSQLFVTFAQKLVFFV